MNVGFTYNVRHTKPDDNDPQYVKEAEFDEPSTIAGITAALEKLGHRVIPVEADENVFENLKKHREEIDVVFNIAEGINGADREAHIPAILEMLGLPYTGPQPLGYAVGLNKAVAKEILSFYNIPTAEWMTVNKMEFFDNNCFAHFPAIAKPLSEGSSKGINARNLTYNNEDLRVVVKELLEKFKQPVLVEEYLPGREFTVAVIGNPARVLPIIEFTFDNLPANMPKFDHFEAKWIYEDSEGDHEPFVCPAVIEPKLEKQIKDYVLRSFHALEIKDWARFDVRLDKNGVPNIIEVNCPPGIMPDPSAHSRFPLAASVDGLEYHQMIEEILKSACKRYNIEYK